jgi:dienelactone hydrolase
MQIPFLRGIAPALSLLLWACSPDSEGVARGGDAAAVSGDAGAPTAKPDAGMVVAPLDSGRVRELDAALIDAAAKRDAGSATVPSDADDAGPEPTAADAAAPATSPQPVEPCSQELQTVVADARPDFGAAPSPPVPSVAGDPNEPGAYEVWRSDVVIPNPDSARSALEATFYAPSEDGGTTVAAGRFALVLVMHGFGLTHQAYEAMSSHMASHGFVVLGVTLPFSLTSAHDKNASEAIAAIDFALSSAAPESVQTHVDAEKIAAAGHSLGGKIAFYAAALDTRIDLVIAWDPSNAGGPPCFIDAMACNNFPVAPNCLVMQEGIVHQLRAETLVFRAAADGANPEPAHNAIHFFRGAPMPATLIDFDATVQHGDWANAESAVLPHTRRVQLAFLRQRFYGHTGIEPWLPRGAEVSVGAARVLYKP